MTQVRALDFMPDAKAPDVVVMGVYPNGTEVKITGHSRAKQWASNPGTAPATVEVIVIQLSDENDARRLYLEFEHLIGAELM